MTIRRQSLPDIDPTIAVACAHHREIAREMAARRVVSVALANEADGRLPMLNASPRLLRY